MSTKTCRVCSEAKDLTEFYVAPSNKDGLANLCKSCHKIKNTESYAKNAERNRAYAKKYKQEHLEAKREYSKKYRAEHREKLNQYLQSWRAAGNKAQRSPESLARQKAKQQERYATDADYRQKCLEHSKKNRQKHPERKRQINKAWVEANREKLREYMRAYTKRQRVENPEWHAKEIMYKKISRAREWEKQAEGSGWARSSVKERISTESYNRLRAWQQNHCYFCNQPMEKPTLEHILPRSRGGSDATQNVALTCASCNFTRQAKIYHQEWSPESVLPVSDKFFLTSKTIGGRLQAEGIEAAAQDDGSWLVSHGDKHRKLFILSTFFCSDRNPASQNGKIARAVAGDGVITLFDQEWYRRTEACINMLKSKLGMLPRGLGARKLAVVELTQSQANDFMDANHVMGKKANVAIRFGLVDDENNLYAVGLFTNKGDYYEWDRLALRGHIPGGMSKIMSALWKTHGYKPIKTFVDSRYATGEGHETVGFKHLGMSSEAFYWVFPDRMQHQRYLSNANKMSANLFYINTEMSNSDNIRANGVYKIWVPPKHIILQER